MLRLSPWAKSVKKDMLRADRLDMIAAYFSPSRTMLRRIYRIALRGTARIVTAGHAFTQNIRQGVRHRSHPTFGRAIRSAGQAIIRR